MKVTSNNHDKVSARLTVSVEKNDYKDKVEQTLKEYAKKANIPGFRKGKAPLSMIKKQHEAGVAYEEINKMITQALYGYIADNKLKIVGQPVPQPVDDLDLNADEISVDFEIGFEPEFEPDLASYEETHYKVEAQDKEINQSIDNMRKRFATKIPQDKVAKNSNVVVKITDVVAEGEEAGFDPKTPTIKEESKEAFALLKGKKAGGSIKVEKAELEKNEELSKSLGFYEGQVEKIKGTEIEIVINEVYEQQLAEIDQDLFDKVYGKGVIKSEEELRERVKKELDDYFQQNADVFFVNNVLEKIVAEKDIVLPEEFLIKWLQFSNENITTPEQAKEIFDKQQEQMKRQIIEGKLRIKYDIKVDYQEVLEQAELYLRNQFAVYGVHTLSEDQIKQYAVGMIKDKEQANRFSSEVAVTKIKDVVLDKAKKKEKKVSYDEFVKEMEK